MSIKRMKLRTFKRIIKSRMTANGHKSRALRITASWALYEEDEDVFQILKQGSGGEFLEELIYDKELDNERDNGS